MGKKRKGRGLSLGRGKERKEREPKARQAGLDQRQSDRVEPAFFLDNPLLFSNLYKVL